MLVTHLGRSTLGPIPVPPPPPPPLWSRGFVVCDAGCRRGQRPPRPTSTVRFSSRYLVRRQANVSNIGSAQFSSLPPSSIVLDPQAPPREYTLFRGSNSVFQLWTE